ncbi:T9SS type A sorting domain-containing protein [bacterium]|nr:T9SS type A sorting domain-containing protein [bacterium]
MIGSMLRQPFPDTATFRRDRFTLVAVILMTLMGTVTLCSAQSDPWPDEVIEVSYGAGAGFGQNEFPSNILGPPDPDATPSVPSSSPSELLTLGMDGWIVLRFDGGIQDLPGPDFTVFENPFQYGDPPSVFRETGIVAVSSDGEAWFEFPYNIESLDGLAGVTPTDGSADPLDPSVSGGDSFDLAAVGLSTARYVRITDSGDQVPDNGPSFDLDAVACLNDVQSVDEAPPGSIAHPARLQAFPNPFNARVSIIVDLPFGQKQGTLCIYDALGRLVTQDRVSAGDQWTWMSDYRSAGVYFAVLKADGHAVLMQKLVLLR